MSWVLKDHLAVEWEKMIQDQNGHEERRRIKRQSRG
jgi:hypothetical protein